MAVGLVEAKGSVPLRAEALRCYRLFLPYHNSDLDPLTPSLDQGFNPLTSLSCWMNSLKDSFVVC